MPKLKVQNLTKSYQNGDADEIQVVDDISFEVQEGELLSILGPSGCGKTTLLKMIAGLLEPDEGQVFIDGREVKTGHNCVGYIFQQESLFPWRTVRQNIEFGLEINGVPREERKKRSNDIIQIVGMEGLEDNFPHEISGGQARKTEMARSLIVTPDILVADEALSNLDAQTRNYLQEEFLRIQKLTGSTIIFVSHNVDEAVFMSDRILVLSNIPAKVIAEYVIEIPKPRTRTSHECLAYRSQILDVLKVEQEKAMVRTRLKQPVST
ncbi:ABC transporter ATP-binding protein [Candidatus Thorarchaeota archaeon]|nr:MAG: ABC transporter ATP-binding protein [Candidatus Thorarchaeota archaeon]